MIKSILNKAQTIEELEALKENFDTEFAAQSKCIEKKRKINEINNGGLVVLIHLFESLIPDLMKTKKGGKMIANFIKTIKNDVTLKEHFVFVKQMLDKRDILLVNESIELIKVNDKTLFNESLDKLRNIVVEALDYSNNEIDFDGEINNLSNAINFRVMNEKTLKNINEHIDSERIINEYCNSNKSVNVNISENINIDIIADLLDNNLSPEECFKHKVNECVSCIEGMGDNVNEELASIKNKLLIKEYNESTFNNDMEHLIDLYEIINKQS